MCTSIFQSDKDRYLLMPLAKKRRQYKCGNKYKTLNDIQTWNQYNKNNVIPFDSSGSQYSINNEINEKVSLFVGDITTLEVDAIVNAANQLLRNGLGVDGAIHSAAGLELLQAECRKLKGCTTGNSVITGGYKLPAKYIIHTVGPVCLDGVEKPDLLQSCYVTALEVMRENGINSIAFPCISTGVHGFDNERAAQVVLTAVRRWLNTSSYAYQTDRIIFCLFEQKDVDIYHKFFPLYFPINLI